MKVLLCILLLVAALMWGEHERRRRMVIGTWQVLAPDRDESTSSIHGYNVFKGDGTGEWIVEEGEKRVDAPFTYTFSGFSRLEMTCDWTYYGGEVVPLDDPELGFGASRDRVVIYLVSIGLDRDYVYISPSANVVLSYWHRVVLKPLPEEK